MAREYEPMKKGTLKSDCIKTLCMFVDYKMRIYVLHWLVLSVKRAEGEVSQLHEM